ncbi:MAG: GNAT family N-acetyltransferase [Mobilitalea sp.]
MVIRKATRDDSDALKDLYFEHLTPCPPKEEQDMNLWKEMLSRIEKNDNYQLLLVEDNGSVVSSVTLVIIENLTHNLRPYAVMENVVTHSDYRNKGYSSALIERASEIAKECNCYKIMLMTGSRKESTLNFYKNNGFSIDEKTAFLKRL